MSVVKKIFKVVLTLLVIIIIFITLFIVSFFVNHNYLISWKLTSDFKDIIIDNSQIEIIESKSVHGKLNGNGNGINYFGTVLVKTDSEEILKKLLPLLDEEYGTVGYMLQIDSNVNNELIEHVDLEYDKALVDGETYYSIYYFNISNDYSYPLDILGN